MKFIKIFGQLVLLVLVSSFIAAMFLEWAVGCGEAYTDAKGVVHVNECIFLIGGNR